MAAHRKLHLFTTFNPQRPWTSIKLTPCGLNKDKFGHVYRRDGGDFFQRTSQGYVDVSAGKICKNCLRAIGYPLRGKETK